MPGWPAPGLAASQIDAIFITHEHGDHIGCARRWRCAQRIPVWMSQGTYAAIGPPDFEGLLQQARDGRRIDLGGLQLHALHRAARRARAAAAALHRWRLQSSAC